MKFVIANDHAAPEIKNEICDWLKAQGHDVTDLGVAEGEKADYPDKGEEAARALMTGNYDYGIVVCGTGIGISIAANKVDGIRCALPQNIFAAQMAKEHNNANMLAFGARIEYSDTITDMISAFLSAQFGGNERHERRVQKIMEIEKKN